MDNWHRKYTKKILYNNPHSNLHISHDFRKKDNSWVIFLIIIGVIVLILYNNTDFKTEFNTNVESFTKHMQSKKLELSSIVNDLERDETVIEDIVFRLVNEERAKVGKNLLKRSGKLDNLAKEHSIRMIQESFFEHSTGNNVGENIIHTPIGDVEGCGLTLTNNAIAECMVDGWIDSPGHYANMIHRQYRKTGVGVYCGALECKGTQNFL